MSEVNPGERVKDFFLSLYDKEDDLLLRKIDYDLMADDELRYIFYESLINYLVRRFITAVDYCHREYEAHFGIARVQQEVERLLRNNTNYNDKQIKTLAFLLLRCLDSINDGRKKHDRETLKKKDEAVNCYICGILLDHTNSDSYYYATVDHRWPHGLGGLNSISNFEIACKTCNNEDKKTYIDASDYHYEEISFSSVSYSDFRKERQRPHELAILAKSNYSCDVCGTPAIRAGELRIDRKSSKDSWHFLNLKSYCFKHIPK
jgi:5-methylcytosine-specific restriction endonuclease McrA